MPNWLGSSNHSRVIGVELQPDGIAVVDQEWRQGGATVHHLAFLPQEKGISPQVLLKSWVQQNKLTKTPCNIVLGQEDYQILLVEPPDVPANELRGAIRWRLKDLLSIPVEQAAIDIFELPEDGTRSNKKMVYVVAAEAGKIKSMISLVEGANLKLHAIDIAELAMRNLVARLISEDDTERGVAVARLRQGAGSVYIFRQGNMYLARSFMLDYNGGLLDDIPEANLALELQRSVDYYERQMGQAPPTMIYVCGDNVTNEKLGSELKSSLNIPVQHLDPAAAVDFSGELEDGMLQRCLGALGGALRQERVA